MLWKCESENVWEGKKGQQHWIHALKTGSWRLLTSRRQGQTPTFTFTGWLFIPQGHDVTVSTSAMYFFIDFGPHCKPHVRFNPKRAIMTMFPLKHEPQPPCAHRTPIKSRADSKLLAGFLFLDFTSWIYINFMIYPSYKMKCHTFFFSLAIVGLLQSSSMAADIIIFGGMYFHKVYFVVLL